ncbi:MAG: glycosyltransferase family 87 protein [Pseudomonadota bacterium]
MIDRMAGDAGQKVLLFLTALVFFATLSLFSANLRDLAPEGEPGSVVPNDFSAFWAAGRLGLAEPLAVLDEARLSAVQNWGPDAKDPYFPFAYPPGWLVAVIPFGALPFAIAWPLFVLVGLAAFGAALWPSLPGMVAERRALMLAALSPPLLFFVLLAGQTTLIWLALLLVAATALLSQKALLAGAVVGLLAIKPQLCPMVAAAFLGYALSHVQARMAVPAAALSVLGVCLLPVLHTGWAYWPAWLGAAGTMAEQIALAANAWDTMLSWYPALRVAGLGHEAALSAQAAVSLSLAAGVAWLWWLKDVTASLRLAGLLLAIPLAAPSAWYYEGIAFALAAVFLAAARYDSTMGRRLHVILVWALPGYLVPLGTVLALPLVTAPMASLLFIGVLREAALRRSTA